MQAIHRSRFCYCLISLMLLLALAGAPLAHAQQGQASKTPDTRETQISESEREDVLLRKMILMGFPAAAVAGLIIALIVTRKKRPHRPDDPE